MKVCAIVPVKPLNRAKSRLADLLAPAQREQLALGMLKHTIHLLEATPQIHSVLVISRDTKALALVREWGASTVQESGTPELNNALTRATQAVRGWGASAALVVPADMPLLTVQDIEQVVQLGRFQNTVVIAPDRHEDGTNLLMVRPPGLITYAFGVGSFQRHQQLAEAAGASVIIHRSERAALDVDTPEDLQQYYTQAKILGLATLEGMGSPDWLLTGD